MAASATVAGNTASTQQSDRPVPVLPSTAVDRSATGVAVVVEFPVP